MTNAVATVILWMLLLSSAAFATTTTSSSRKTASKKTSLASPRGGGSVALAGVVGLAAEVKTLVGEPLDVFLSTVHGARRHLTAAAVARSISIFGMYPMDTIKTRIQIEHPRPFSSNGLYSGVGGCLLGQVPYGVLTFGSYEVYKKALQDRFPNMPSICSYALAAVLGDLTGSGWLCPSEVIKQKMQAGMYKNTRQAFVSILKTKGVWGGLYQGYWGGVARDVPFRVAQLTSYEVAKKCYLKLKARRFQTSNGSEMPPSTAAAASSLELSAWESALIGAVAGSFSAAVTSPLDRIKTILMTNNGNNYYGGSVISCATRIIEQEGMAGLMTGLWPRVVYIAPSVALFFVAYEASQQKLKHWL